MRKLLGSLALVTGLVALGAAPASADYVGDNPDGAVLNSTVAAGETVTFLADCFVAGATVTVSVSGPGDARVRVVGGTSGTNEASGEADGDGAITAAVRAWQPGTYTITATGARTSCGSGAAEADFRVLSASAAGLPRTGSNGIGMELALGATLVVLGAMLVTVVARRRRTGLATV